MKRIVTFSTLLLFFAIGFSACEKIEKDTPAAIKKLIREYKLQDAQVIEYEYNNEYIYKWWEPGCIDAFVDFYDKNANLLWQDGGFTGGGDGKYPKDFYDKAIYKT
jgi:hypothetical protein